VLAALRVPAVLMGIGSGALAATLVSLLASLAFQLAGAEGGARAGLVPGMLAGFAVGGHVAGRMAFHSHRFHGSVTGLGLTALVVFIARGGGSEATLGQVLLLALIGIIVGGFAGAMSGRRTQNM
jgi:hypothetical protein